MGVGLFTFLKSVGVTSKIFHAAFSGFSFFNNMGPVHSSVDRSAVSNDTIAITRAEKYPLVYQFRHLYDLLRQVGPELRLLIVNNSSIPGFIWIKIQGFIDEYFRSTHTYFPRYYNLNACPFFTSEGLFSPHYRHQFAEVCDAAIIGRENNEAGWTFDMQSSPITQHDDGNVSFDSVAFVVSKFAFQERIVSTAEPLFTAATGSSYRFFRCTGTIKEYENFRPTKILRFIANPDPESPQRLVTYEVDPDDVDTEDEEDAAQVASRWTKGIVLTRPGKWQETEEMRLASDAEQEMRELRAILRQIDPLSSA